MASPNLRKMANSHIRNEILVYNIDDYSHTHTRGTFIFLITKFPMLLIYYALSILL